MKIYIVLFKDGSMLPVKVKPDKRDYQPGARFFEVEDDMDLAMLSNWYGRGHNLIAFKEII